MRSWSIRAQMFLVVICAGVPLVCVIAYNVWSNSQTALASAQLQTGYVAAEAANSIDEFLAQTERYEALLAQRPLIRAADSARCDPIFARTQLLFPEFDGLALYSPSGNALCGTTDEPLAVHDAWFQAALHSSGFYLSNVYQRPDSDHWGVTLSYPVSGADGTVAGILAFHADMIALQHRVIRTTPSVVQIGVLDRNATFAFRTLEPDRWIGKQSVDADRARAKMDQHFSGFERQRGIDGILRVYGYRVVPKVGWLVGAGVAEDEVFAFPLAHVRQDALIALLAACVALLLARWVSLGILRPIQNLHQAATKVARGDAGARATVEGTREVAIVAQEFNHMLDVRDLADRERQVAEARYRAIFSSAKDAIITVTDALEIVQFNPAAEAMFQLPAPEAIGSGLDRLIPQLMGHLEGARSTVLIGRRTNGEEFPIDVSFAEFQLDAEHLRTVFVRDVTQQIAAEKREKRQANFYAALSHTNQAIVRIADEAALYREICRVCVDFGHATMAYVALVQNDSLVPVAWSGPAKEFLTGIQSSFDPHSPFAAGPSATAVTSGTRYVSNNFLNDPRTAPWRERAAAIGTRSIASFPFRRNGKIVGILGLHVNEPNFFNDPLIALLEEMTGDLSFALDNFAKEAARAQFEQESRQASERFEKIFRGAPEAIVVSRSDTGEIVLVNDAFCQMFDYAREDLIGRIGTEMGLWGDQRKRGSILTALNGQGVVRSDDGEIRTRSGELRSVLYSAESIELSSEPHLLLMFSDITARKRSEARIEYLATHDSLTDLPNRSLIRDRIAQAIRQASRTGGRLAVLYLDVDRFKAINDSFGHPFGDQVLTAAAKILSSVVRASDTVARQSGDEFLILLPGLVKSAEFATVAEKIFDAFDAPIRLQGRDVFVNFSIGISSYPEDGGNADDLIENADMAMYRAKDIGRRTFQRYTPQVSEHTRLQGDMETRLRTAIAHNELSLVYQPKAHLGTGQLSGCEALLRWNEPELGSVPPSAFIPIAEESGLIVPIGDWVLRTACLQNKAWQQAGMRPIPISVNISARQFMQQDVVKWVQQILEDTGLEPECLELELTESLIAQDIEKVIVTIKTLKAMGVGFSIDDFGTGYSSLSYLRRFGVDTLKIDQSFIRNMLTNPDDAVIALSIISLAHSLRLNVIAEGVETEAHCNFLRNNGCDEIQGYFLSKPVSADEFAAILTRANTKRVLSY